jgi:hypothetical protein
MGATPTLVIGHFWQWATYKQEIVSVQATLDERRVKWALE